MLKLLQTQLRDALLDGVAVEQLLRQMQDAVDKIADALEDPAEEMESFLELASEVEVVVRSVFLRVHYPATCKLLAFKLQDLSHTADVEIARIWYNSRRTSPNVPEMLQQISNAVEQVSWIQNGQ